MNVPGGTYEELDVKASYGVTTNKSFGFVAAAQHRIVSSAVLGQNAI